MGFGQHTRCAKADLLSYATGEYKNPDGSPCGAVKSSGLWGHNRLYVIRDNGQHEWRLHKTAVVLLHANGELTINNGGWRTQTTSAAVREAISLLSADGNTLARNVAGYWHNAKKGGAAVRFYVAGEAREFSFATWGRFGLGKGAGEFKMLQHD